MEKYDWLRDKMTNQDAINKVRKLGEIAGDLGVSMAQLALAWLLKNPNVSTVITGASRVEQVQENMKAIEVVEKLTPNAMETIGNILE